MTELLMAAGPYKPLVLLSPLLVALVAALWCTHKIDKRKEERFLREMVEKREARKRIEEWIEKTKEDRYDSSK